jgi:hypothetical protein
MSYADTRSRAADMLADKGQTMTLAYVGGGTYNPATGTTSGSALPSATVKGVILPLSPFAKQGNSNIVAGDQQCLLAAEDVSGNTISAPQVGGTVTDANGKAWAIIAVEPLSPAGTDVLHDLVVRRQA